MLKIVLLLLFMLSTLLSDNKFENKDVVQTTPPDFEGYVTIMENQRALVVSSIPRDTGGIKEFSMKS